MRKLICLMAITLLCIGCQKSEEWDNNDKNFGFVLSCTYNNKFTPASFYFFEPGEYVKVEEVDKGGLNAKAYKADGTHVLSVKGTYIQTIEIYHFNTGTYFVACIPLSSKAYMGKIVTRKKLQSDFAHADFTDCWNKVGMQPWVNSK